MKYFKRIRNENLCENIKLNMCRNRAWHTCFIWHWWWTSWWRQRQQNWEEEINAALKSVDPSWSLWLVKICKINCWTLLYCLFGICWRVEEKCHSPNSISFWQVLVSVRSPFWRVFEKNGFHTDHDKFLNLHWRKSRWKLNPKSKNNQTDTSCTKCIVGLCYLFSFYYFNTTWVICIWTKLKFL